MNNSDKKQFAELMTINGEILNKEISKTMMAVYFDDLKEFPIDQIVKAFSKHRKCKKHGMFFPKPADIVRNIDGERQTCEDRAMIAWMEIERCMARFGAYGTLELDDKQALMAVKSLGSWQHLCHTDRDKLGFKRQEFIKNYEALENTPIEMLPERLPGIEDLHNQRLGIDNPAENLLKQLEARKNGDRDNDQN